MTGRSQLANGCVTLLITFMITIYSHVATGQSCRATSVKDVLDAAAISKQIYLKQFKEGDTIPGMDQGYKVVRAVTKKLKSQTLRALVAVKGNTEVICFMGTKTATQLFQEFRSGVLKRWHKIWLPSQVQERGYRQGSAQVMAYYLNAIELLEMSSKTRSGSKRKVIITGHSLGGALASVLALQMAIKQRDFFHYHPYSALITFGAPRTGNGAYAKLHDQLIPPYKKLRFVFNGDPAPHVPLNGWGFSFVHASREIWIEEHKKRRFVWKKWGWIKRLSWVTTRDWTYHVCADGDHKSCSRSQRFPIFAGDHNIDKYIGALKKLRGNRSRLDKFRKDQCRAQGR